MHAGGRYDGGKPRPGADERLSESQTFREQTRQALAQLCLPEILKAARISYLPAHDQMDALGAAEIPFSREFAVEQNGNAAQRAFEASL